MFNPSITPFQPGHIDQTMAMLSGLKDQGKLQQYVMQHQNCANLVALASQVNSMSQQAPQPGPQGTVKDQAIQQMAPPQPQPGQPMCQPGNPEQQSDPEIKLRRAIDESIANKDFDTAQELIKQLKHIDKLISKEPVENMVPEGDALAGEGPNTPNGTSPMALPEDQGIGTLPAQNIQQMAGGGITGMKTFKDGDVITSNYKQLTQADLPSAPTSEDVSTYANTLFQNAQQAAAGDNQQTNALYDPFIQKLQKKQANIDDRKNNNLSLALLQTGLGIMGGTSPYAGVNIAQGGEKGIAAYISGRKSIDDSQDLLDHSQFLMAQAKDAAIKGNTKDQIALQNTAQTNLIAGTKLKQDAAQIMDTSAYRKGESEIAAFKANIDKQKAEEEAKFNRLYKGPYYKAEADAALRNASTNELNAQTNQTKISNLASPEQKEADQVFRTKTQKLYDEYAKLTGDRSFGPSDVPNANILAQQINNEADNFYGARPHLIHPGYVPTFNEQAAQSQTHIFSPNEPGKIEMNKLTPPPQVIPRAPGIAGLPQNVQPTNAQPAPNKIVDFSQFRTD